MNNVKFVCQNESIIRGEDTSYQITNFITKESSPSISLAVSRLNGEAPKTLNTESDRIYYFLEGSGQFTFDNQTINPEPNSALFIPKNTEYQMKGNFKAILVNSPAFDIQNEIHS